MVRRSPVGNQVVLSLDLARTTVTTGMSTAGGSGGAGGAGNNGATPGASGQPG